jgi:2-polyprenyl-3-methyl-5-hydroxy-6-metoxy-1,4-benzoquinol methylase
LQPQSDNAGHYAKKQLFSRSRLVAWSHSSRFETAKALVAPFDGGRLLDYGCGDGTFVAMVADCFASCLGADVTSDQIEDCRRRLAGVPRLTFALASELDGYEHEGRYDVVVCMEVLEHCPDDVQVRVLEEIARVMAPTGTAIVSVPIEIGATLIAKQAARALAAMQGLTEYATRERYAPAELARMVFAGAGTAIERVETVSDLGDGRALRFTGHKGFNWRRLRPVIAERFAIDRVLFSPMPPLGSLLNSQVWFVCRKS